MQWEAKAGDQDGTITRRQLRAYGLQDHDVRRLVRRRDLSPVLPGVFLTHTGPPSQRQREWAAVLYAGPAALWSSSALPRRTTTEASVVHVAVETHRRVRPQPGVQVHRVTGLSEMTLWHASPPRVRAEAALVEVASRAPNELDAIAVLSDAVQARTTTPRRLRDALDQRGRLPRRQLLQAVVQDLAEGAGSVLEHRYLTHVERAHGLPRAERQASLPGFAAVHDVLHRRERVVVELDGRAHHSSTRDRFRDLERDTAALLADHVTLRLGWGQVVGQPCRTARQVATLLAARGWAGSLRPCQRCTAP